MITAAYSFERSTGISLSSGEQGLDPLELDEVRLAPPDVLVDRDPVALQLVVVPHEPGDVLGSVLARFGREEAEAPVEGDTDAPLEVRVAGDALVEAGIEIGPVMLETQDERLVVEAGGEEGDLLDRHTDELGEVPRR